MIYSLYLSDECHLVSRCRLRSSAALSCCIITVQIATGFCSYYLRQGDYVFACVRLFSVCLSVNRITQQKCSTDFHNILWKVAHGPMKEELHFGGCGSGFRNFWRNSSTPYLLQIAMLKAPHHNFGRQQSENTQSSGPQIERINKGCRGGDLRCSSASLLV